MGTWGTAAWDNDSAADWFGEMFEKTKLAKYVEKTLKKNPEDEPEEIRAAAYVMVALGRTYIWPIDDIDNHLALAVSKLEAVKSLYAEKTQDFATEIEKEIATLKSYMSVDNT